MQVSGLAQLLLMRFSSRRTQSPWPWSGGDTSRLRSEPFRSNLRLTLRLSNESDPHQEPSNCRRQVETKFECNQNKTMNGGS